ncbi:hypothetical protein RvY_06277 [Ramazzottius varieornatus]|uniref:Uncharacterized protein n=1 Tax=Ramazzottius varieornatus TaxID=947166 RepID=A0A1D1UXZ3_RAMVA|nr:hypothetical protein RvY_06277 [Ramazzottius varieornatus]
MSLPDITASQPTTNLARCFDERPPASSRVETNTSMADFEDLEEMNLDDHDYHE